MSGEMAAALRAASFQLITEAGFAERSARDLLADADAHGKRAQGLRDAAALIDAAIAEEQS